MGFRLHLSKWRMPSRRSTSVLPLAWGEDEVKGGHKEEEPSQGTTQQELASDKLKRSRLDGSAFWAQARTKKVATSTKMFTMRALIITSITVIMGWDAIRIHQAELASAGSDYINLIGSHAYQSIWYASSDIHRLVSAIQPAAEQYLLTLEDTEQGDEEGFIEGVFSDWMATSKGELAQVRLFDIQDHERIRVEASADGAQVVSPEFLQDKSHMPYTLHFPDLVPGAPYISNVEPNVEWYTVQTPHVLMYRVAMGIFNNTSLPRDVSTANHPSHTRLGTVVLNVFADHLWEQTETIQKGTGIPFQWDIVRNDGVWLDTSSPGAEMTHSDLYYEKGGSRASEVWAIMQGQEAWGRELFVNVDDYYSLPSVPAYRLGNGDLVLALAIRFCPFPIPESASVLPPLASLLCDSTSITGFLELYVGLHLHYGQVASLALPVLVFPLCLWLLLSVLNVVVYYHEKKGTLSRDLLMLTHYVATTLHEVRTPLHVLMGCVSILKQKKASEQERKSLLQMMEECGTSMLHLIDNVLSLSKSSVPVASSTDNAVSINMEVQISALIRRLALRANESDVDLYTDLSMPLPMTVEVDWRGVEQVITNLVMNAIKFTPKKGTIKLACEISYDSSFGIDRPFRGIDPSLIAHRRRSAGGKAPADAMVKVTVSDTGIGIDRHHADRIFLPYEQANGADHRRKYGGAGLGLTISRNLAQNMEGDLGLVSSVMGVGSTFQFTFPVRKAVRMSDNVRVDGLSRCFSFSWRPQVLVNARALCMRSDVNFIDAMGVEPSDQPARSHIRSISLSDIHEIFQQRMSEFRDGDMVLLDIVGCPSRSGQKGGIADVEKCLRAILTVPEKPSCIALASNIAGENAISSSQLMSMPDIIDLKVWVAYPPWSPCDLVEGYKSCMGLDTYTNPSIQSVEPAPPKDRRETGEPSSCGASHVDRLKILVVDDIAMNRKVLCKLLEMMGHEVSTAEDGEECIQRLLGYGEKYHVVFMDYHMPIMDGCRATATMVEKLPRGQRPAIVGLTASPLEEERLACLESGMDSVLIKPAGTTALELVLSEAVKSGVLPHLKLEECSTAGR